MPAFSHLACGRIYDANRWNKFPCTILLAAFLSLLIGQATLLECEAATKRKHGETRVSVPVFLATDRKINESDGKGEIDFGKQVIDPLDVMTYGLVREDTLCTLPDTDKQKQLIESGWYIYTPPVEPKKTKDQEAAELKSAVDPRFQPQVFTDSGFEKLAASLEDAMKSQPPDRRGFVIYVHGCCLDFKGSMQQAADLASSVQAPVLAYSWGCSTGYGGSSLGYPRTQERFNNFLIALMKAFPKERVCIVGNSIGNHLLINFCLQCRPEDYGRQIDELVISRADIDDVAFRSQLHHVEEHTKKVILYVAKNDFQINLSGTLRWFFYPTQHGERAGHVRAHLYTKPSLTVLDVSPLKMGHVIPYDSVADLFGNMGSVPNDSSSYHYVHENSNLYRVQPRAGNGKKRTASSSHRSDP